MRTKGDEMDWIALGEFLVFRVIGPLLTGFVLSYLLHTLAGVAANLAGRGDMDKVANWAGTYMLIVFQLKDYLFIWALGVIVFMLIGLV
jgi:hypothetical protein